MQYSERISYCTSRIEILFTSVVPYMKYTIPIPSKSFITISTLQCFFSSVCCHMANWKLVPMNTLLHCQITYKATILRYNILTIVQLNIFSTLWVIRWYKITIMRRRKILAHGYIEIVPHSNLLSQLQLI